MQTYHTITGIIELALKGFRYKDICGSFNVGSSVVTGIKKKFKDLVSKSNGLTVYEYLDKLKNMEPEDVQQLFYPGTKPKLNKAMPEYSKVYEAITRRNDRHTLYDEWMDYKKDNPEGYMYTQFKLYFRRWREANHLPSNLTMAINRIPGEIMYID